MRSCILTVGGFSGQWSDDAKTEHGVGHHRKTSSVHQLHTVISASPENLSVPALVPEHCTVQGGPEKTAQNFMRYNFSTADHRVTRFPAKCSEINW